MQEFEKRTTILKKKQPTPLPDNFEELRSERAKKMYKTVEKVGRRQQEEMKTKATELEKFKADEEVVRVLGDYTLTMSVVFDRYAKVGQPSAFSIAEAGLLMNYQGFNRFASEFNVYPGLLSQQDTLQIFRQLTREQQPSAGVPIGLAEHEFSEVMIKIALAAAKKLGSEEDETNQPGRVLTGLFEWLGLPTDPKLTSLLLKEMGVRRGVLNPRDKKKLTRSSAHQVALSPVQLQRIRKGY
jgi:hypothetical protein